MNKEQVYKLAKKAGFSVWSDEPWKPKGAIIDWSCDYDKELVKFAKLVVKHCNKGEEHMSISAEKQEPWVKTYCGGKPNYTTPAEKQEPVAWREVAGKTTQYYDYNEDGRGEPLYAAPVHASDISQERVDETAKDRHDLVYRLRKRAEIRRQIPNRKSVQEGQPDRIADLLEEAADALEKREWTEQPDLARVGEVGVWGEEKNA
jgi:nitric oxide reductase activation protein